jgi:hypothetical protein
MRSKLTTFIPLVKKPNFVTSVTSHGARGGGYLRRCAINWNAMGLITNGVTGIFHLHNRSGHTMALGSDQPLSEISTRNNSLGVKGAFA